MSDSHPLSNIDKLSTTESMGRLRIKKGHKDFASHAIVDPITLRLEFLLKRYPGIIEYRPDDLNNMDQRTKKILLHDLEVALGLSGLSLTSIPYSNE